MKYALPSAPAISADVSRPKVLTSELSRAVELFYSVTRADGELVADEIWDRAEALRIAAEDVGYTAWAHGRAPGFTGIVAWEIWR